MLRCVKWKILKNYSLGVEYILLKRDGHLCDFCHRERQGVVLTFMVAVFPRGIRKIGYTGSQREATPFRQGIQRAVPCQVEEGASLVLAQFPQAC